MKGQEDEFFRTAVGAATPPDSEAPPATMRVPSTVLRVAPTVESSDTSLTRSTEKALTVAATVTPDQATITVLSGLNAGQVFALDSVDHVIGRGTHADLWFEDAAISRSHARISRKPDGRFVFEDLGSTNGSFVQGQTVERGVELRNGDRIQLGPTMIIRFALTDHAEASLQQRLYESSTRDALTQSFNRKHLNERLVAEIAHTRRHKNELTLLMLDLDRFKNVNDTHGHLAGDDVLRTVASHVQRMIRIEDVFARYGGEEFVILIRSIAHAKAGMLAERVRSAVERLQIIVPAKNAEISVTTSIGFASLSELPAEAGAIELLAAADTRLFRAKADGRNRVCGDD